MIILSSTVNRTQIHSDIYIIDLWKCERAKKTVRVRERKIGVLCILATRTGSVLFLYSIDSSKAFLPLLLCTINQVLEEMCMWV